MIGHVAVMKMRISGKKPKIVFLNDYKTPQARDWSDPGAKYGEEWPSDHATVEIEPTDSPKTIDLRFLKGVAVSITGSTENRAKQFFDAAKKAGATTVAATHLITSGPFNRVTSGWTEVWHG